VVSFLHLEVTGSLTTTGNWIHYSDSAAKQRDGVRTGSMAWCGEVLRGVSNAHYLDFHSEGKGKKVPVPVPVRALKACVGLGRGWRCQY
jgi:hypothetical protein